MNVTYTFCHGRQIRQARIHIVNISLEHTVTHSEGIARARRQARVHIVKPYERNH